MSNERNWKNSERRNVRLHQKVQKNDATFDLYDEMNEILRNTDVAESPNQNNHSNNISNRHHGLGKIIDSIERTRVNHSDGMVSDKTNKNEKSNVDAITEISLQIKSDVSSANSGCSQEQIYYAQNAIDESSEGPSQIIEEEDHISNKDQHSNHSLTKDNAQNDGTIKENQINNEFHNAEGPIIYADDDSDSVSQITSSIAGSSTFSFRDPSSRFNRLSNHSRISDIRSNGFPTNGVIRPRPGRKSTGTRLKGATAASLSSSNRSVGSKGSLDDLFEVAIAESSIRPQSKPFENQIIEEGEENTPSLDDSQYDKAKTSSKNFNNILEKNDNAEPKSDFTLNNSSASFFDSIDNQSDKISEYHSHSEFSTPSNLSRNNKQSLGLIGSAANRIVGGMQYLQQQYTSSKRKKDDDHGSEYDEDYFGSIMSGSVFQPQNYFSSSSSLSNPYHRPGRKKFYQTLASLLCLFLIMTLLILILRMSFTDGNENNESMNYSGNSLAQGHKQNDFIEYTPQFNEASISKNHIGMELPEIFNVFSDVDEIPFEKASNLPFFWHVPRTGGGTMNDILADCLQLTVASNAGVWEGHGHDEALKVVKFDHYTYVNVDLSTFDGIERAKRLSMVESGIADVAVSSLLYEAATMFNEINKARMFALFRHPVERAVSLFHFVQDTQWRRSATKNENLADIKIEEFFKGGLAENNWMTRFLSNQLTKGSLDKGDLDLAKEVLRRKCLVGILKEKGESFSRFERYFGWQFVSNGDEECHEKKLEWAWPLKHRHEEVEEGTELWELIVMQNKFDIQLYEYAEYLFHEQKIFFSEKE
jgi:hypothetical protein